MCKLCPESIILRKLGDDGALYLRVSRKNFEGFVSQPRLAGYPCKQFARPGVVSIDLPEQEKDCLWT